MPLLKIVRARDSTDALFVPYYPWHSSLLLWTILPFAIILLSSCLLRLRIRSAYEIVNEKDGAEECKHDADVDKHKPVSTGVIFNKT